MIWNFKILQKYPKYKKSYFSNQMDKYGPFIVNAHYHMILPCLVASSTLFITLSFKIKILNK
jgi:hypothetical protein